MKRLLLQTLLPLKEPNAKTKEVVMVVAVVGEWHGHDMGSFKITADDLVKMKENAEAQQTDVVIDYEHQTLYGGEAPAAGWISKLEVKGDELLATVTWTKKAIKHIKEGEYKYLSPVYAFNSRDPKTDAYIGLKLHSVALTNTPFIDELGEVKANKTPNQTKENIVSKKPDDTKDASAELQAKTDENIALKEELATQKVDAAIANKKITAEQKEWALTYCKENPEGFKTFIESQKEQKQVPSNNTFANKQNNNNDNTPDVVAMALKEQGE